jgi:transcriptional regulator GlxA family with amidase domain
MPPFLPAMTTAAERSVVKRRVCFALYPGFQLLDVAGPLAAFELASLNTPGAYDVRFVSSSAGDVTSSVGVAWRALSLRAGAGAHTLLTIGSNSIWPERVDPRLVGFLRREARRCSRVASVCSGAFLLAAAGLLDGKRATTHWACAAELERRYPAVHVEPDRIWVRDGNVWTSAGVTAGIDLALALIADDLGGDVAKAVARQLVVYTQRPGGQSQFSDLLALGDAGSPFGALHLWIQQHLRQPLSVERLAAQVKMSPRTFARAYRSETGVTPAKAVERLRLEAARAALDAPGRSLQQVADLVGFMDTERMRRAFVRHFGAPPATLRRRAG